MVVCGICYHGYHCGVGVLCAVQGTDAADGQTVLDNVHMAAGCCLGASLRCHLGCKLFVVSGSVPVEAGHIHHCLPRLSHIVSKFEFRNKAVLERMTNAMGSAHGAWLIGRLSATSQHCSKISPSPGRICILPSLACRVASCRCYRMQRTGQNSASETLCIHNICVARLCKSHVPHHRIFGRYSVHFCRMPSYSRRDVRICRE